MLITISREYGAGGSSVARVVAKALGWEVVDNQLVDEVAARAGITPQEVRDREERGPTFVERVARALTVANPEVIGPGTAELPEAEEARLVRITEQVVADAAVDRAVLVGRAASAVIGRREGALHVKLVGSVEYRAGVLASRLTVSHEEALKRIHDTDAHRARYHRQYYNRDWADPHAYHLTLNTEWLGIPRAAAIVVAAVEEEQA
ncbi:MAG: cytidylate kinase-like family protein [Gemmatimonadota bacterium]